MTIDKKIIDNWMKIFEHGDASELQRKYKVSRSTLKKVLETRETTIDVYDKITQYFTEKKQRIEELNNQNLQK